MGPAWFVARADRSPLATVFAVQPFHGHTTLQGYLPRGSRVMGILRKWLEFLSTFWNNRGDRARVLARSTAQEGRDGQMTRRNRNGFTLVELLVVIVIITMLVGLLIPAIGSSRERARQAQCTNNQHEIGLAVIQYETAKKQFPGYVNKFGTTPSSNTDTRMPLSWTTVILPYLGNETLWRDCRGLKTSDSSPQIRIPQYVCPSSSRTDNTALTYAANCGQQDGPSGSGNWDPAQAWDTAANGVFHNRYATDKPAVSSSSLRDGASNTILFTENLQGRNWFANSDISTKQKLRENEPSLGIVWWSSPTGSNYEINSNKDDPVPASGDYNYARPSSNHVGGVVVTMCDGHQRFLSERISYATYQHLMTPNSADAELSPAPNDPELLIE